MSNRIKKNLINQRKCFDESTFKWIVAYYIIGVNVIFINHLISIDVKLVNEDPYN